MFRKCLHCQFALFYFIKNCPWLLQERSHHQFHSNTNCWCIASWNLSGNRTWRWPCFLPRAENQPVLRNLQPQSRIHLMKQVESWNIMILLDGSGGKTSCEKHGGCCIHTEAYSWRRFWSLSPQFAWFLARRVAITILNKIKLEVWSHSVENIHHLAETYH